MSLEFEAFSWLKFEKNCPLVIMERSPREWYTGEPDVLGITNNRYMLEIEIKRTLSDFRANMKKRHIVKRCSQEEAIAKTYRCKAPRQFWFLVPPELRDKVLPEVPEWAGLLIATGECVRNSLIVAKKAPTNSDSEKLSLKDCAKLLRNVGNQLYSLMATRHGMRNHYNVDPHAMDDFYSQKCGPAGWVRNYDYLNFQI